MKFAVLFLLSYFWIPIPEANKPGLQFEIIQIHDFDVPSASGISKTQSHFLAIGDDSPFLFEINDDFTIKSKTVIFSTGELKNNKIPKKVKPDFEAIEFINETEFIIFGSGSKSPARDIFIYGSMDDSDYAAYSLTPFYKKLSTIETLASSELNIEGVAIHNDSLYLLNRINSVIIIIGFRDFLGFVQGASEFPGLKAIPVELPEINGIASGFSGATIGLETPHLLFTCSVENTGDAYNDGAILGSFIGMVPLAKIEDQSSYQFTRIASGREPLKVESITVSKTYPGNRADLLLSTDSDGGQSLLIEGRIAW